MDKYIFSVHQINTYVQGLLNRDPILEQVWIRGEISNFKLHSSGHMYFTLKDGQDKIRCVMFMQNNKILRFLPSDGMKVIVRGQISLYCKEGLYQLYAFEALKSKLKEEGLFNADLKKPIPHFPKKVAVITSQTGAAIRDIIKVIRRRCKLTDILIIPVLVQGKLAVSQISSALDYVSSRNDVDVVILGRGGGSIEELWAFNEEEVARAIWRCKIPVISAIGHETDFTIADFVADLRAPTPSAAGELAVPDLDYMGQMLEKLNLRMVDSMNYNIINKRLRLENINNSYVMKYPGRFLNGHKMTLDQLRYRLRIAIKNIVSENRQKLSKQISLLNNLNPSSILLRGYASVTLLDTEKMVTSINNISKGDMIKLQFNDGKVLCLVENIQKKDIVE